ncbi:MAG: NHLP bacteriocin system secretion protein [Alphaproteobacteria bacterium]|nr:NHLP bacteriocin system secretion protein [Alphaproteobacteria bacterium]
MFVNDQKAVDSYEKSLKKTFDRSFAAISRSVVFRKATLERLASPEQLDRLVTIADPRHWIVLAALWLLAVVVVAWGFLGEVPTSVPAKGILVAEGGRVLVAMSPTTGTVAEVLVSVGDTVRQGQPVAAIRQTEALRRLAHSREVVAERERELASRRDLLAREVELKQVNLRKRQAALRQSMEAARQRRDYLTTQMNNRQELSNLGYATADRIEEVRVELNRARQDISDGDAGIAALEAEITQVELARTKEMAQLEQRLAEARRGVGEIETSIDQAATVLAPGDGRVTEVKLAAGAVVALGQPVLSIESAGAVLQGIVYIPTEHGKKVRPGMLARVEPSMIRKEEYGTLVGKVVSVSDFPATRQGIAALVQNDTMVEQYTKAGAPYEARVNLVPAATPSGYAWTSGDGPAVRMTSGTVVEANIAVERRRPVDLILPLMRKAVGIDG